jgi:DNA-directed RNA polymerase specialized sigma24 family protein
MISLKRRREIAQGVQDFLEAYMEPSQSAEKRAWLLQKATKRLQELHDEALERRIQGLPPPERKKPIWH